MGAKGVGELGIVGLPAAIANAIFHVTGKRIRELPIIPALVEMGFKSFKQHEESKDTKS